MADVFVSYARTDKALVAPLVAAIEGRGWSVWWDPEIAPGQEFDDLIAAELGSARAVVVVWTPVSVASRWVRGEAREAADRGILVPARFAAATLPFDVRAIHTIDLDGWGDDPASGPCQELLRALEATVTRKRTRRRVPRSMPPLHTVPPSDAPARLSICVLPFANMSGEPEQEYFSDGISEDIITDLSKVSALAVTARNTAFTFKGKHVDIAQVARQLKVSHVLEGSVRKAGQRVRITAQLIDGKTGSHLWAERYDRDLNDIFSLQDEISQAIVAAMKLKLLPDEKKALGQRGTSNPEAYKFFLMARQHYLSGVNDARRLDAVIRLCQRAVQVDPGYAHAWALMAAAQRVSTYFGKHIDNGLEAAERALALDANLAEAHAARAGALLCRRRQRGRAAGDRDRFAARPGLVGRQSRGGAPALSSARLRRCDPLLREGRGVQRERLVVVQHADQLLHGDRRQRACARRGSPDTGGGGEARPLGARQRRRHGRRGRRPRQAGCRRAREGMGRTRGAARPRQHEHALQRRVHADHRPQRPRRGLEMLGPYVARVGPEALDWIKSDPDMDAVRGDARFQDMIRQADARLGIASG